LQKLELTLQAMMLAIAIKPKEEGEDLILLIAKS
jgi:hypothetical protein